MENQNIKEELKMPLGRRYLGRNRDTQEEILSSFLKNDADYSVKQKKVGD